MTKTVPQAALHFSQPVRQIALMLILTVLVAVGGWLVAGTVWRVVVENPFLNGLIFVVFFIGLVTCFWQVAQLVTSVRWIEGFAANRPGLDSYATPRLLAPLAALLRSRGARGGHISSTAARSILDSVSTRIDEARDITRYITNLLIFLGLLGTLYGLSTTVPAVVDTIRALAPKAGESSADVFTKLMSGLEAQLGGMGTAFSSSLLGLAGSLVVGLLELFATHGQNRFYGELEDWLSSFTRLAIAGPEGESEGSRAVIAALAQHLEDQAEFFQAARTQAENDRARADEGLATLAAALSNLAERLENGMGNTTEVFQRIADGQDRIYVAMTEEGKAPGGGITSDAESRMRLRSIDTQMMRLLEEVVAGRQDALADLRTDIAQLVRSVRAIGGLPEAHRDPEARG